MLTGEDRLNIAYMLSIYTIGFNFLKLKLLGFTEEIKRM